MLFNTRFTLNVNVLWLEDCLGIAINQSTSSNQTAITTYYFWPRNDVWDQIKIELDSKPWIKETEKVDTLNLIAKILDVWQSTIDRKNIKYVTSRFKKLKIKGLV